jgi:hypothetical protein
LYRIVNDVIGVAKSANFIIKCCLEPLFVPCCFFKLSLEQAGDMGPDPTLDGTVHAIRDIYKARDERYIPGISPAPKSTLEFVTAVDNLRLEAYDRVCIDQPKRSFAILDIHHYLTLMLPLARDTSCPVVLLETYLNAAELRTLEGDL